MPERLIHLYEGFSRAFPWIIGLAVNFISFQDAFFQVLVTCVSMVSGAVSVHFLKPTIVALIMKFKKKQK